jgi:integrase
MAALRALAEHSGAEMSSLSGPVFRAQGRTGRPLSYRLARSMLTAACRRAGYPVVEAVELRAGFASWLRAQGLSDHEVAEVLGLARVRSVDDLLRRHAALGAQRTVRERIGR